MPLLNLLIPHAANTSAVLPVRSLRSGIGSGGPDISKFEEDNFSGVQVFDFVPVNDVQYMPPINERIHTLENAIVLKAGKNWIRVYSTQGTMKYTEKKKASPNGFYYHQSLEFNVPKDRKEITALFTGMEQFRFICKYKDLNQKWKILGTLENPFEFLCDLDTGAMPSGKANGHECNFICESDRKSPFYVNEAAAAIVGIGVMRVGSTFKIN